MFAGRAARDLGAGKCREVSPLDRKMGRPLGTPANTLQSLAGHRNRCPFRCSANTVPAWLPPPSQLSESPALGTKQSANSCRVLCGVTRPSSRNGELGDGMSPPALLCFRRLIPRPAPCVDTEEAKHGHAARHHRQYAPCQAAGSCAAAASNCAARTLTPPHARPLTMPHHLHPAGLLLLRARRPFDGTVPPGQGLCLQGSE